MTQREPASGRQSTIPTMDARAASVQALKTAVYDLFNLYLGATKSNRYDEGGQESNGASTAWRRISASNKLEAPKEEQFVVDIMQLQNQIMDQEQLRIVTESTLATLLASSSGHMVRAEFLLSLISTLLKLGLLRWDSFVPLVLRAAYAVEFVSPVLSTPTSAAGVTSLASTQVSTPAPSSPASAILVGSPTYSAAVDASQSPMKGTDTSLAVNLSHSKTRKVVPHLRQLVCKVILNAVQSDLRPVTHVEILAQIVQWINTWDEGDVTLNSPRWLKMDCTGWLYECLDVIKVMVDDEKCRVPFYALLHDRTQLNIDRGLEDKVLFAFFLEVHRRRDRITLYMQMLDQHLQCPTFATQRMVAFTYQGILGEPLYGQDVALAVQRDTLDWERAMRCLRHGLRAGPSADWWRRVLVCAPRFPQQMNSTPSAVFTAEMTCEAVLDQIMELMQHTTGSMPVIPDAATDMEALCWQEWLSFADHFYYLVRYCYLDILEFIDKLDMRLTNGGDHKVWTNHVTWLLAQVFRLENVTSPMSNDPKKVETTKKILSFHKEERSTDLSAAVSPQNMLLDFVSSSQILRLWSMNPTVVGQGKHPPEHFQKGKQIDEWWKQVGKGERVLDFSNLDEKSLGMIWILSHTICQPVCEAVMSWMKSSGFDEEVLLGGMSQTGGDRLHIIRETRPLPMTLLSGFSIDLCTRLVSQIEDLIFGGQMLPSIGMMETYARLILIAPQTLFRCHLSGMMHKYQQSIGKSGVSMSILELLNFRLLPLYRYHGKVKQLLYDLAKIIISMKTKRGEHRIFRLVENLCLNLIMSLPEVILVKRELKGAATEFSETLNRAMIINLAFTIKTRGIPEFEQLILLSHAIDQILANSSYCWSEKTLRHFPPLLRERLQARQNNREQTILGWQQAEASTLMQLRQLLSPSADPSHLFSYVNHMMPAQHRQYLCAAAWVLVDKHLESVAIANLGRVLKELSPEDVTLNIYAMIDVLLFNAQLYMQNPHSAQEGLYRVTRTLASLLWSHELLPFDIVLLALADRDDDSISLRIVISLLLESSEFQQRVHNFCSTYGQQQEHWQYAGPFQRLDPQQALGNHLIGKDRFPVYFDEMCLRLLPVIPLVVYRLVEHDVFDPAERILDLYAPLMAHHPMRFTFVRDCLAYFYGHLPSKFIIKLLTTLDLAKIPFSGAFLRDMPTGNSGHLFVSDYFTNLLLNIVNHVLPPLTSKAPMNTSVGLPNDLITGLLPIQSGIPEIPKAFYQHQDPGTYGQLILETSVIELLSLPHSPGQIVSTLINISIRVQPYAQSHPPLLGNSQSHVVTPASHGGSSIPRSPSPSSGASDVNSASTMGPSVGTSSAQPVHIPSFLLIQACGLLLAQLPSPFHTHVYTEVARIFKECSWLTDPNKSLPEMDAAYGYSIWDPTWAAEDDTSTITGNTLALIHAFGSNLSFEWLEGIHVVITLQRPFTSIAQLRLAFRIMGPLLPRLAVSKPFFAKTLALLFTILTDVFGQKSQVASNISTQEISDLIDFLYHAVVLEGQAASGKPRPETLLLCSKAVDRLHPDLQHMFRHLTTDTNMSIYAATHPKLAQMTSSARAM